LFCFFKNNCFAVLQIFALGGCKYFYHTKQIIIAVLQLFSRRS
jgi:hypothetical protein